MESLHFTACNSLREYGQHRNVIYQRLVAEADLVARTAPLGHTFLMEGYCEICDCPTKFHTDTLFADISLDASIGTERLYWRERLVCVGCGLNNRMRAAVSFLLKQTRAEKDASVYLTEQIGSMYRFLSGRFTNIVGSEYLAGLPPGSRDSRGIRSEDMTRLTFTDASFDFILSFDVFEHIYRYRDALDECYRCLKPGGQIIFTVPFLPNAATTVLRAEVAADGAMIFHMPPEYHGNPVGDGDSLCFRQFGWDLIDVLKDVGFADASAYLYWSSMLGHLGGGGQFLFSGTKNSFGSAPSPVSENAPPSG
jgi:SAM-dependent methyltransferase